MAALVHGEERALEGAPDLPARALAKLKAHIEYFDDPRTPYLPRLIPRTEDSVGDYDHLARVREWSATAEDA